MEIRIQTGGQSPATTTSPGGLVHVEQGAEGSPRVGGQEGEGDDQVEGRITHPNAPKSMMALSWPLGVSRLPVWKSPWLRH